MESVNPPGRCQPPEELTTREAMAILADHRHGCQSRWAALALLRDPDED